MEHKERFEKLAEKNDKDENSDDDKEEEDNDEESSNDDYSVNSMNAIQEEFEGEAMSAGMKSNLKRVREKNNDENYSTQRTNAMH